MMSTSLPALAGSCRHSLNAGFFGVLGCCSGGPVELLSCSMKELKAMDSRHLRSMLLRSPFRLPCVRQMVEPFRANGWPPTTVSWKQFHFERVGFKQSRVVENGFMKNRRAESAAKDLEMAELSVFMSLAQSDILTSRFAFQTHAPEEFRKGFVDRLPESAFRARPGIATIDVSGVRGNKRTPDWLTCSPATWTKQHLEPCLLTESVPAHRCWCGLLPAINENSIFEFLLDDAEANAEILVQLGVACMAVWVGFTILQQRAVHGATTVQADIRLVTVSPAEPLATTAARCAFWSAGEEVLGKLAKHLELDELGPISSCPLLLEAMIRHFHTTWMAPNCSRPSCGDPLSERISCRPWFAKKISRSFWMPRTEKFWIKRLTMLHERKRSMPAS